MGEIIAIAAVGIFVIGVVVGIVLVASYGIRREQKQGLFFADQPSNGVNWAARRLNGLYIVRPSKPVGRDADLRTRV
ncbi:MAG: hypothetical protein LBV78_07720 [Kitasatospora sp.]|jgi:hypothetical protein|nr:hypothetical protein [Kitasatospora sp.]